MIGESGGPTMSQAAFIRSLSNSFFKKKNGLFSSNLLDNEVLPWSRNQQAAFIILLWIEFANAVSKVDQEWAQMLRNEDREFKDYEDTKKWDIAFLNKNSFLARDQGVRAFSTYANDFFYLVAGTSDYSFDEFNYLEEEAKSITNENIDIAIKYIKDEKSDIYELIKQFCRIAAKIDWRTPSAEFTSEEERIDRMRFRGSGGYSQFWKILNEEFQNSQNNDITRYSTQLNS